jgi:hypothetical protein
MKYDSKKFNKYILIFLSVVILLLSGYYNFSQPPGIEKIMRYPAQNEGHEISISGQVISSRGEIYSIYDPTSGYYITVQNNLTKWHLDDFVSIKGVFNKEGYLTYIYGEIIWDRKIKFILSAVGFIIVMTIVFIDRKKINYFK